MALFPFRVLGQLTTLESQFVTNLAGLSYAQGDILYYDGANMNRLPAGTSGWFLKTQGVGANPTWVAVPGGGDVLKVGTPANNQIGIWTGDGTIEGDSALTFDTATDSLVIAASGNLLFGAVTILDDAAGTMTLSNIDALDATTIATISSAIGAGNVSKVGTPANNQIGVWTGDGTIEGDASLTWDGTNFNIATAKNFQIAGATILADAAGTTTLSNIDALDATTESTIEAAIDTLANLTSIQGRTVTLSDAGANAIFGWDDVASAYENLTAGEARAVLGLATTDSPMFTGIELGHASDTTIARSGAGAITVEGVQVALNSISLVHTASTLELGHASDTTLSRSSAGILAVEGVTVPLNSTTNIHTAQQIELGHATDTTLAREAAGIISIENEIINGYATIATAAGTTALTRASAKNQVFTGTTTQTVTLPTTGIILGQQYVISNKSTGKVTVQSSGANTVLVMGTGMVGTFTAQQATPTTAAHWEYTLIDGINDDKDTTASANAATINLMYVTNTISNNSAATLTITLPTAGAVDGQRRIVRVLDFSAVTQTITWVNTETAVTPPTPSNGSTTLPKTAGFQFNGATSLWRCIAAA